MFEAGENCRACGKIMVEGASYCHHCGEPQALLHSEPLNRPVAATPPPPPPPPPRLLLEDPSAPADADADTASADHPRYDFAPGDIVQTPDGNCVSIISLEPAEEPHVALVRSPSANVCSRVPLEDLQLIERKETDTGTSSKGEVASTPGRAAKRAVGLAALAAVVVKIGLKPLIALFIGLMGHGNHRESRVEYSSVPPPPVADPQVYLTHLHDLLSQASQINQQFEMLTSSAAQLKREVLINELGNLQQQNYRLQRDLIKSHVPEEFRFVHHAADELLTHENETMAATLAAATESNWSMFALGQTSNTRATEEDVASLLRELETARSLSSRSRYLPTFHEARLAVEADCYKLLGKSTTAGGDHHTTEIMLPY